MLNGSHNKFKFVPKMSHSNWINAKIIIQEFLKFEQEERTKYIVLQWCFHGNFRLSSRFYKHTKRGVSIPNEFMGNLPTFKEFEWDSNLLKLPYYLGHPR